MTDKITLKEKAGFGLMNLGSGTWQAFINTFLLYFYTNVAHLRPAVASAIISLAVIWDAVNDPLFASWADNHHFGSGEKMRPLILTAIPLALCLVLTFVVYGNGGPLTYLMAFLTYFVLRIPSTLHTLPVNGMKQLASGEDHARVSVSTWASGGGALGMALSSIIFWPIIRATAKLDASGNMINPRLGFIVGAAIAGAIVIAASLFHYFTTKERVQDSATGKISFGLACKALFGNRDFVLNVLMMFLYGLYAIIISGYALYYCTYVLEKPGIASAVMATYVVGILITLPFVKKLYQRIGRSNTIMAGASVLTVGGLVFIFFAKQVFAPFVLCLAIGIGTELMTVMLSLNRADITDNLEKTEKLRLDGMVNNVIYFAQKLGNAVLTFLLGLVLEFSKFDGSLAVQPESALNAIVLIMGLTAVLASVGIGVISRFVNLKGKEAAK